MIPSAKDTCVDVGPGRHCPSARHATPQRRGDVRRRRRAGLAALGGVYDPAAPRRRHQQRAAEAEGGEGEEGGDHQQDRAHLRGVAGFEGAGWGRITGRVRQVFQRDSEPMLHL